MRRRECDTPGGLVGKRADTQLVAERRRGSVGSGVRAEDTVSERRDTLSEPAPETKYRVRYPSHVC